MSTVAPLPALVPPDRAAASRSRRWSDRRWLGVPVWGVVGLALLAVAGASAASFWPAARGWYDAPPNWGEVEPGLVYRSGQISRRQIEATIAEHGLRTIVFMSEDKPDRPDVQAEQRAAARLGVERFNFPLDGNGTGNPARYVDAVAVVARSAAEREPVLVHCHSGAQRTGGVVALYRVLVRGGGGRDAYAELLRYGHDPKENPRLVPYLNDHMGEIAAALAARGVIPQVPHPLPRLEP